MPRGRGAAGGGGNVPNVTETVAATVAGISTPAGDVVDLEGYVDITTGAGTTSVQVRLRRGVDATGTQIGSTVQPSVTAGNRAVVPINASDTPGELAGASYVITVQQVAATAVGTINSGFIGALW